MIFHQKKMKLDDGSSKDINVQKSENMDTIEEKQNGDIKETKEKQNEDIKEIQIEDIKEIQNEDIKETKEIILRPINIEDFRNALLEVSASVSENAHAISELRRWNEMYGEGGSRKKPSLSYFG